MLNSIKSYLDYDGLIRILNTRYSLNVKRVHLKREMIGHVYIVETCVNKYVLKLYRPFNTNQALQSIEIIQHLKKHDYPVVTIVQAYDGSYHFTVNILGTWCVGILFNYIHGIEPDVRLELTDIGQQVGKMHNIMGKCPRPLISRGKEFYIDRFINILKEIQYSSTKTDDLEKYGSQAWESMIQLPNGFCHGDLHSGNMFKTGFGRYVLFDFDIASNTYSIIDAATLSNATNFNRFDEAAYEGTKRMFDGFYQGYSKERTFTDKEVNAIFDFIAIRHFELIATITECEGNESLGIGFLDQQHDWLMRWKNICEMRGA